MGAEEKVRFSLEIDPGFLSLSKIAMFSDYFQDRLGEFPIDLYLFGRMPIESLKVVS